MSITNDPLARYIKKTLSDDVTLKITNILNELQCFLKRLKIQWHQPKNFKFIVKVYTISQSQKNSKSFRRDMKNDEGEKF
jgi:hypothetical protein